MTLLRAADLRLTFGSRTVFENLNVVVEEGERVGLVGVNGSGKSSLMKILAGVMAPDSGLLQMQKGSKLTYLPQEPVFPEGATIESELNIAQAKLREAIQQHEQIAKELETAPDDAHEKLLNRMQVLGDRIEHLGGWDTGHQARTLLDRLGVKEWDRPISELSGGNRKRVAIARALLEKPDMLLLDEPTNHLDADTVDWLEEALDDFEGALLLVTHDRYFLDDLVDRIVEIQPGEGVTSYPGNYEAYLEQKLVAMSEAETAEHKRGRWIMQEVAWLRKGAEARRTKSKARIERATKLLAERGFKRPAVADLRTVAAPRLGHTVIEAEHVTKSYGTRRIFTDASFILNRGERIGIVGPNGAGKTTFLRVMLGELPADSGKIVIGKNTKIAYYDQQRGNLDPELTVYEAASDEEWIELGDRKVALRDYLEDLLFPVPMQRLKVKALSGGERNRLLLAKLFLEGANVLVLDEPTNDLDIVTLNVLERLILDFTGSVLLVTHDRYFIDKVANGILAFEGNGKVVRYPGNYSTYRTLKRQAAAGLKNPAPAPVVKTAAAQEAPKARKVGKLSFKDQHELDGMEAAIELAERQRSEIERTLGDPSNYAKEPQKAAVLQADLERRSNEIDRLYARWEVLQKLSSGA